MEIKFVPDPESFGDQEAWKLISRSQVDGLQVTVRAMPVEGRGCLISVVRGGVCEPVWMMDRASIVETVQRQEPAIVTLEPQAVVLRCLARQLVDTELLKSRLPKDAKRAMTIYPGFVLTLSQDQLGLGAVSAP